MVSSSRRFLPAAVGLSSFCAPGLLSLLNPSHAGLIKQPSVVTPFDGADAPGDEEDDVAATEAARAEEGSLHDDDTNDDDIKPANADVEAENSDLLAPNDGHKEGRKNPGEGPLRPSHGVEEEGHQNPGEGPLRPSYGEEEEEEGRNDPGEGNLQPSYGEDGHEMVFPDLKQLKSEANPLLPIPHMRMEGVITLVKTKEQCGDVLFLSLFANTIKYAHDPLLFAWIILMHANPRPYPRVKKKKTALLQCLTISTPFHPGDHDIYFRDAVKRPDLAANQPFTIAFEDGLDDHDGDEADMAESSEANAPENDADAASHDEAPTAENKDAVDSEDENADEETSSENEPSNAANEDDEHNDDDDASGDDADDNSDECEDENEDAPASSDDDHNDDEDADSDGGKSDDSDGADEAEADQTDNNADDFEGHQQEDNASDDDEHPDDDSSDDDAGLEDEDPDDEAAYFEDETADHDAGAAEAYADAAASLNSDYLHIKGGADKTGDAVGSHFVSFPLRLRGRNGRQAHGKPNVRVKTEAELDVFFHEKSNLDPG